jgi:hypothetical protein
MRSKVQSTGRLFAPLHMRQRFNEEKSLTAQAVRELACLAAGLVAALPLPGNEEVIASAR